MRHISLDLIRVTEAAAIAASKWVGSGNKELADKAATDAMRERLNEIDFCAQVIIGEGEKDESYGLYEGEWVGAKETASSDKMPQTYYELAIDPIEGTTPTVTSGPEAISVLAVANQNSMFSTKYFYMNKLAYGPQIRNKVRLSLEDSIERTVELSAFALGKSASRIVVCILNRPRHNEVIAKLRKIGVRIKLIQDCDVSGAVASCLEGSGVDLLYGIGGAPEAVISACAIKCLRGDLQSQVVSKDWAPVGNVLGLDDLVKGECAFVATGITNGSILKGVNYKYNHTLTHSVFMRSESGTFRQFETTHGN